MISTLLSLNAGSTIKIKFWLEEFDEKIAWQTFTLDRIEFDEGDAIDSYFSGEENTYKGGKHLMLLHKPTNRPFYLLVPLDELDEKYIWFSKLYVHTKDDWRQGERLHFKEIKVEK